MSRHDTTMPARDGRWHRWEPTPGVRYRVNRHGSALWATDWTSARRAMEAWYRLHGSDGIASGLGMGSARGARIFGESVPFVAFELCPWPAEWPTEPSIYIGKRRIEAAYHGIFLAIEHNGTAWVQDTPAVRRLGLVPDCVTSFEAALDAVRWRGMLATMAIRAVTDGRTVAFSYTTSDVDDPERWTTIGGRVSASDDPVESVRSVVREIVNHEVLECTPMADGRWLFANPHPEGGAQ